jgi:hypothetical protein
MELIKLLILFYLSLYSLLPATVNETINPITYNNGTDSIIFISDYHYINSANYFDYKELKQVIQQRESRGLVNPNMAISPCGRYLGKYQIDYYLYIAPLGITHNDLLSSDSLQEITFDNYMDISKHLLTQNNIPVTNANLLKSWSIGQYWFTIK